jgi:hypothetical protein
MAPIAHFKGNRSPSLTDTISIDGVAFDLTGCSVKLKMRAEGSSTLKVDTAAVIVTAAAGTVRYDWASNDVDTAGDFLFWWEVTLPSAKTQDTPEFEIVFLEHAPPSPNLYVQVEEFKSTLTLTGTSFSDEDVRAALKAASRAIDEIAGRRFYPDADAAQVRYYSPVDPWRLTVDDVVTITTLKTDTSGDGTFENTWTLNTDYTVEPLNAAADGEPWTHLCARSTGTLTFPTAYARTVELTGKFGWNTVPSPIEHATTLLAHRLLRRAREVPFGISGIGLDGSVVRIMAQDPDVMQLVAPYSRAVLVA